MKLAFWKKDKKEVEAAGKRPGTGIKILMVDDEESFLRLTKRNLEAEGFEVRTENRARAAVAAAKEFLPNLVLLDVMMPDGSGGDVAAELGRDPDVGSTPVIFLTAAIKGSEVGGRGAARIGGRFYIAKPVAIEDLIGYIEKNLACPA